MRLRGHLAGYHQHLDDEERACRQVIGAALRQAVGDAQRGEQDALSFLQDVAGGAVDLATLATLAPAQAPHDGSGRSVFVRLCQQRSELTLNEIATTCGYTYQSARKFVQREIVAGRLVRSPGKHRPVFRVVKEG